MKLIKLILVTTCLVFTTTAGVNAAGPLKATTVYEFVGDQNIFEDGRLLAWEGSISGDINGVIRWWLVVPYPITGQVSHFEEKWQILSVDLKFVLLEGYNAGTTTNRPGKSGVWRSNGIVTYVSPDYPELDEWFGRHMHESGEFFWEIPDLLPSDGTGILRIN